MYERILVPVDGSETSDLGLKEAIALARAVKGSLVLLNVVNGLPLLVEMASSQSVEDARRGIRRYGEEVVAKARQLAQQSDVAAEGVVRDVAGDAIAPAILQEVRDQRCGLIVMGTHGRRGLKRLALGSDAQEVLRESPVPVLLVRGPDTRPL